MIEYPVRATNVQYLPHSALQQRNTSFRLCNEAPVCATNAPFVTLLRSDCVTSVTYGVLQV